MTNGGFETGDLTGWTRFSNTATGNLFQTHPGNSVAQEPTVMNFDVSAFAGQTVRLRFALTASASIFNAGIDKVQVANAAAVPEISSLAIFMPGMGAILFMLRR